MRTAAAVFLICVVAPVVLLAQDSRPADHDLPRSTPAAEGVSESALGKLVKRAEETHSDALVLIKNGKLIGEWYFGHDEGPIHAMSVTKSVVSLGIGHLVDTGAITSLDQPVHEFFPEWNQGRKKAITVRHLLNHTSGMQADPTTGEIYASPDFVKLALAAELESPPGTKFFYNNKAVNLLAGLVKTASGVSLDTLIADKIFTPLGISKFEWMHDHAGNPHVMAGLCIRPIDLAKIGQLVANQGVWKDNRILSKEWIEQSSRPSQPFAPCGLLWWLVRGEATITLDEDLFVAWRKSGADDELLEKLAALKDRPMTRTELDAAVSQAIGKEKFVELTDNLMKGKWRKPRVEPAPTIGVNANGYLGQWLVVLPKDGLVAVRMRRQTGDRLDADARNGLPEFPEMVRELVR